MKKSTINIEYVILWRCIHNVASEEEQQEVEQWLKSDEKHHLFYSHLKESLDHEFVVTDEMVEKQWSMLHNKIQTPTKTISIKKYIKYVAAVAAIVIVALVVFRVSDIEKTEQPTLTHNIQPGGSKAILQLADGNMFELSNKSKKEIHDSQGNIMASDSMDVLQFSGVQDDNEVQLNTIKVPRGGEYKLVLADGSMVWLNSDTKLRFPVAFSGNKREVFIDGEAYFKVSKDNTKPFYVHTAYSSTKVYGTEFNIMSYEDENHEQTTLVEGSIAVLYNNKEVMIKPGQQALISKKQAELTLAEVDTRLYTDWKNGIFRFENMPLEQLAHKLSRWYDVEFFFANEDVKSRKVTGAYKRSTNFDFFMQLIEQSSESDITITEKSVLIKGRY